MNAFYIHSECFHPSRTQNQNRNVANLSNELGLAEHKVMEA